MLIAVRHNMPQSKLRALYSKCAHAFWLGGWHEIETVERLRLFAGGRDRLQVSPLQTHTGSPGSRGHGGLL